MASLTVNYSLPFGASIRIGYRVQNSSNPFTYISGYPSYNDSPFIISGLPVNLYEVELTTICPNCSGGILSNPVVYPAQSL